MLDKAKTIAVTVLVCIVIALGLVVRYQQGAIKGVESAKNDQITELQKQVETLSNLK